MARLAEELGVARTTLYRWTGERDRLISDILWADTKATLDVLTAGIDPGDWPRTETIATGFLDALAANQAVRVLLRNEGQRALLLLTVPSSSYRTRLLDEIVRMICEDARHGYRPPESPELLADAMISIAERYLHNGGEPDANPDPEMAKRAIALLLRE